MDTFSIGGVFGRTRRIFGLHAVGMLVFAFLVSGLPAWLALFWGAPHLADFQATTASQPATPGRFVTVFALSALPGIVTYFGNLVLAGTVAIAAWRDVDGRPADFAASLRAGARLFLPLLLVSILSGLGIALGSILLVIPGLILAYMWLVVIQVYAIERPGFTRAFGRSRHLTSGYRWRLVGLSLIYLFAYGAASGVITGALAAFGRTSPGTVAVVVLQLLGPAVTGFFAVVSASGLAATYIELRRAKEGYLSRDLVDAFT